MKQACYSHNSVNMIPFDIILSVVTMSIDNVLKLTQVCYHLKECFNYTTGLFTRNKYLTLRVNIANTKNPTHVLMKKYVNDKTNLELCTTNKCLYFVLPDILKRDEYFVDMCLTKNSTQKCKYSVMDEFEKMCGKLHIKDIEFWVKRYPFLWKHYAIRLENESTHFIDICTDILKYYYNVKYACMLNPHDKRTILIIKYFINLSAQPDNLCRMLSSIRIINSQCQVVLCKNDIDLMLFAIKKNVNYFDLIGYKLKNNKSFIAKAVEINPSIIKKIPCNKITSLHFKDRLHHKNPAKNAIYMVQINAWLYKMTHCMLIENPLIVIQLIKKNPMVYMHLKYDFLKQNHLIIVKTLGAIINYTYNYDNHSYDYIINEIRRIKPKLNLKVFDKLCNPKISYDDTIVNSTKIGTILAKYDGRIVQKSSCVDILLIGFEEVLRYILTMMKTYYDLNIIDASQKFRFDTIFKIVLNSVDGINPESLLDFSIKSLYDPSWITDDKHGAALGECFCKQSQHFWNEFIQLIDIIQEQELVTIISNIVNKLIALRPQEYLITI